MTEPQTEPADAGCGDDTLRENEVLGELTEPPYDDVDIAGGPS